MKKIFVLVLSAMAVVFSSCSEDLLDNPKLANAGDTDTYYVGDDAAEAALVTCYYYIRQTERKVTNSFYPALHELGYLSDEYVRRSNTIEAGKWEFGYIDEYNSAAKNIWSTLWRVINACNRVTDEFSDGDTQVQQRCVAEAKVVKAWAYSLVGEYWGNAPLLKNIPKTNDEFYPKNSTQKEIFEYAIQSCDEAIASNLLPQKANAEDKEARATKELALAIKGKIQVMMGDYANAKTTLKQVVDSPKYRLLTTEELSTLLCNGGAGKLNPESLFEIYKNKAAGDKYQSVFYQWFTPSWIPNFKGPGIASSCKLKLYKDTYCNFQPSKDFITEMLANEGFSARFNATFGSYETLQEWGMNKLEETRTPENAELLANTKENVPTTLVNMADQKDAFVANCGFFVKKFLPNPETDFMTAGSYSRSDEYCTLFRLSEVYLLYAEACAVAGDSDGSGLKALNAIAKRAGYVGGDKVYPTLTLQNVQNEKRYEMYGEFCRYNDLIRWGLASSVLVNKGAYKAMFYGYKAGKSAADIKADGSNIWDVYETRIFDTNGFNTEMKAGSFIVGQHEFLPFPNTEMDNNPNLVQNPGY